MVVLLEEDRGTVDDGAPAPRPPRPLREAGAVLAVVAVVAAAAAAFAVPHVRQPSVVDDPLRSLLGLEQGQASLYRVTEADGGDAGWESTSVRVVPGIAAVAATESTFRTDVTEHISPGGDPGLDDLDRFQLQRADIVRTRPGGEVERDQEITVLGPDGLVLFGYADTGDGAARFDPPLLLVPHDPEPGDRWEAEGDGPYGTTYEFTGAVVERGSAEVAAGRFDDCVTVRIEVRQAVDDRTSELRGDTTYCEGIGRVSSRSSGAVEERSELVSSTGVDHQPETLVPPAERVSPRPLTGDPRTWHLQRAGRAQDQAGTLPYASTAPVWVDATTPLVLFAEEASGDLIAIDAGEDLGRVAWRFHPEGPVYGEPTHDPARGRIYFGASDKRLYALDERGLYLWSTSLGDNVASRPAVTGELVVVGADDGTIRALDADSGAERWRVQTDDAVVSGAAVVGPVVVAGSDDGVVRGIDRETGSVRWTHEVGGAVQADVVATDEGTVVVAADGGAVVELDAETGDVLWDADVGGDVGWAPAVGADAVHVVDDDGDLTALDRTDGSRRWLVTRFGLAGGPAIAGDVVIAVTDEGRVLRVGADGEVLAEDDAGALAVPAGTPVAFGSPPAIGPDAAWIVADDSTLYRLGDGGATGEIPMRWLAPMGTPPLGAAPVVTTPVPWQGQLVQLDAALGVSLVDPATGEGERLGEIVGVAGFAIAEPAVVGDTLVVDLGTALAGVSLPDLALRWHLPASSDTFAPPVVADGLAIFADAGQLVAVEPASGDVRWRADVGEAAIGSSPFLADDLVIAGSPVAAYDVRTGEQRWRSDVTDPAGGGVATDEVVVVSTSVGAVDDGRLWGLDLRSGEVRWTLDADVQNPVGSLRAHEGSILIDASNVIAAHDPATGELRWRTELPEATTGTIGVGDGVVLRLLPSSRVVALDATDGTVVAAFPGLGLDLADFGLAQRPTVVDGTVVIPTGFALLGLEEVSR